MCHRVTPLNPAGFAFAKLQQPEKLPGFERLECQVVELLLLGSELDRPPFEQDANDVI